MLWDKFRTNTSELCTSHKNILDVERLAVFGDCEVQVTAVSGILQAHEECRCDFFSRRVCKQAARKATYVAISDKMWLNKDPP